MAYYTRGSVERFRKDLLNGGFTHIKCGTQLRYAGTGRSIWWPGFCGGPGEVRNVAEIYCPKCDPKPALPVYGAPIYETEVVQL